jgi:hypothetical protein
MNKINESYLDLQNLKRVPLTAKGCQYYESKIINFSEIYIPISTDVSINLARNEGNLDQNHVNNLAQSFKSKFDNTEQPPIVQKGKFYDDEGKIYTARLITGNHTVAALKQIGRTKAIFDIYVFGLNGISELRSISNLQAVENNKNPQKSSSIDDLIFLVTNLINKKELKNNEQDILSFLNENCDTLWPTQKKKIILAVLKNTKGYQDVKTYTAQEVVDFIENNTNYTAGGKFDHQRGKTGWSVLESYEYEFITSAMLKYYENNSESYFLCHTYQPTIRENLHQKRNKIITKKALLEKAIIKSYEFFKKNGRWPWHIEGFLPQDRKNKEDRYTIIDVNTVLKNFKKNCNVYEADNE